MITKSRKETLWLERHDATSQHLCAKPIACPFSCLGAGVASAMCMRFFVSGSFLVTSAVSMILLAGCGGAKSDVAPGSGDGGAADAGAAGGGDAGLGCSTALTRAPEKHRPAGMACPQQRAPSISVACMGNDAGFEADGGYCFPALSCATDSDCTKGTNGRCMYPGAGPAVLECSYDDCFQDSDCKGTACECRASSASDAPNSCAGGNCATDSDCGENGYCSPSAPGLGTCPNPALCGDSGLPACSPSPCACGDSCGHGYFCHTTCDSCIDDSDCSADKTCNYDTVAKAWICEVVWPIP